MFVNQLIMERGDVFVSVSEVRDDIKERDRVSFEIVEEKNRKKAINVTLL